ncbi:MAG: bifunctional UDP-N-acetylglucosamine diphosphorylase/glucosamine-1-phosphate N-acetyltransferase GlmU [Acidiferrobacterales bacterium]
MRQNPLEVVILAAGKGTRMYSALPKVLHELGGKPLLSHVIHVAHEMEADAIHVVYGHGGDAVRKRFPDSQINWVLQERQLGTGHAVAQAMPPIGDEAIVVVIYGDVPLIRAETLRGLVNRASQGSLALLTAYVDEPGAYGRIVRNAQEQITAIVEQRDASPEQLAINEINTGFLAAPARYLRGWVENLDNDNNQQEYYLTDIVAMAVQSGIEIESVQPADNNEIFGVNTKGELAILEREFQRQEAEKYMELGATLIDPTRFDVRGHLELGRDVVFDVNVICEGEVKLGDNVRIGANVILKNVSIDANSNILPNSVIEDADIGSDCSIGPFARIRPGTRLSNAAKIGNFVEVKNSQIGVGSKVNHLTYIGDTSMGAKVNVGAGVITANYDGANKHRTKIGNGASIGANNTLVAPVEVGDNATIGAGTVLRKNAPPDELTVTISKQQTIKGWERPKKKK